MAKFTLICDSTTEVHLTHAALGSKEIIKVADYIEKYKDNSFDYATKKETVEKTVLESGTEFSILPLRQPPTPGQVTTGDVVGLSLTISSIPPEALVEIFGYHSSVQIVGANIISFGDNLEKNNTPRKTLRIDLTYCSFEPENLFKNRPDIEDFRFLFSLCPLRVTDLQKGVLLENNKGYPYDLLEDGTKQYLWERQGKPGYPQTIVGNGCFSLSSIEVDSFGNRKKVCHPTYPEGVETDYEKSWFNFCENV